MLRGTIAQTDFSEELYEEYGKVLLALGDMYEAGKYLFLAGNHIDQYREAIDLYLSRNPNKDYRQLYSSFPRKARLGAIEKYPAQTRVKLEALGFPAKPKDAELRFEPTSLKARIQMLFGVLVVVSLLLVLIIGFLHGLYIVGRWLTDLFR